MKPWLKRLGVVFGVCAVCFIVFVAIEHFRGKWALQQRLAELRKQGEELSVAALEPKHPPADQNAALFLLPLTNRILSVKTNLENSLPSLRFAAPGRALTAWPLKEWTRDGKTTNNWNEVGSILNPARELLGDIHSAITKPAFDSGFDYRKGFVDSELSPVTAHTKNVAQLLMIAMLYELNQQRIEAAHKHLCALVQLAVKQSPEPLIISQLVRQTCVAFAFNATWQALQAPGWSEPQLATLQAAWQDYHYAEDMAATMIMERAMELDMFEQLRTSKEKMAKLVKGREQVTEMVGDAFGSLPTHGWVLQWINLPLWRFAWADQDALRSLDRWQAFIKRERIARTQSWAALAEQSGGKRGADPKSWMKVGVDEEAAGWFTRFRFLFSTEWSVLNDHFIRRVLFSQTQQQMVVTALALKRHQLRTGNLPTDLSALVPGYLSALPRDSMDGQPLRYRALSDGGFLLYSVGEDGMDHGGNPALAPGKNQYRQIWDGQDAVWPAPATDEEAAAAIKSSKVE